MKLRPLISVPIVLGLMLPALSRASEIQLAQPANMTVLIGETADQVLSGSDPSGAPLTFTLNSGPSFVEVTTTGPANGNAHVAPGPGEQGAYGVTVQVSDGILTDSKTFQLYALVCM